MSPPLKRVHTGLRVSLRPSAIGGGLSGGPVTMAGLTAEMVKGGYDAFSQQREPYTTAAAARQKHTFRSSLNRQIARSDFTLLTW